MRNYIIFYAAIIVFVIGGIKWTSYVIEKEKEAELNKIDFHKNVADLLVHGGEVLPSETAGKNIVIYLLYTGNDSLRTNFVKFNELNNKYGDNTAFYLFSRYPDKEQTASFFKKINVEPDFKIVSKPGEFSNYIQSLSRYFYTKEDLDKVAGRYIVPIAVVINNSGKIKLYKAGNDKDIMDQVEAALK